MSDRVAKNITIAADVEQYQLLVQGGGGTFTPAAGITAGNDGAQLAIALESGVSGDVIAGVVEGVTKAKASAAIAKFARFIPAADGEIVALASQTNCVVAGRALEAAAADGDIIEVLIDFLDPRVVPV